MGPRLRAEQFVVSREDLDALQCGDNLIFTFLIAWEIDNSSVLHPFLLKAPNTLTSGRLAIPSLSSVPRAAGCITLSLVWINSHGHQGRRRALPASMFTPMSNFA